MNIEVKTNDWVLPNRVGYNKKIYNTFNPSKYQRKKEISACNCSKECERHCAESENWCYRFR